MTYTPSMSAIQGWRGVAFNQATESENRIHADDVARKYGFRGGLVPGVTVYAYLVQPAVAAWGMAWLEGGHARAVFRTPLMVVSLVSAISQSTTEINPFNELLRIYLDC